MSERHVGGLQRERFVHGRDGRAAQRRGCFQGALFAEVTDRIVPVAIDESWRLMQRNFWPIPFGVRVRVRIGDPIARRPGEDLAAIVDEVRARIADDLTIIRSEVRPR